MNIESNERQIPNIEISKGWFISDIVNHQDCEDAIQFLTTSITKIESALELEGFLPPEDQRVEWIGKTRKALRFKKAALTIVTTRYQALEADTANRRFLKFIRDQVGLEKFTDWSAAFQAGVAA